MACENDVLGQSGRSGGDTAAVSTCFWCERPDVNLEDDHIFPRAIGGTKELSVRSCRTCQTSISKAESALSRKSTYAMHLLEAGPRGRDRRRDPASGQIEAEYVLVPHPLGGYNETEVFRCAESMLTCFRHIPCKVSCTQSRTSRADTSSRHRIPDNISSPLTGTTPRQPILHSPRPSTLA